MYLILLLFQIEMVLSKEIELQTIYRRSCSMHRSQPDTAKKIVLQSIADFDAFMYISGSL